ncbi:MAG: methenyltetrahydromethanopterin cyclohydrolase [Geminicoccaceae bacterium]
MSDDATMAGGAGRPSVGRLTQPLVASLSRDARALRLAVQRTESGATIIDAGIGAAGGIEAGRRIAEICMGGLGRVEIGAGSPFAAWPFRVSVSASDPVMACLASQYAGWSLAHGEGDGAYFAMASGPGRARAAKEELFQELAYTDSESFWGSFVLETDRRPPDELIARVAGDCALAPSALTFILTPTTSLAGAVQITARVLEVAMHKVHALGFPLERVRDGLGAAPLPPPSPDFLTAMSRTNDTILFGGEVQLFVSGPEEEARALAAKLPSSASRDFGQPFGQIFKDAGFDFYKIDPMLFSPARVLITCLDSGRTFSEGAFAPDLLAQSFGDGAA